MKNIEEVIGKHSDSVRGRLVESVAMITKCEDLIVQHYNEDQMKTPMHMSVGDESCVAGVVECFREDSYFFGYYRTHSLYLAVARDPYKFFAELLGKKTGSNGGVAGSMHMSSVADGLLSTSAVVASTLPLSLGAALSNRILKEKSYSVVFFGDGAIEEGVFHETLNMAAFFKLPILFVCLDNGLAIDLMGEARQGFKSIKNLVEGYKCEYVFSDNPGVNEAYGAAVQAKRLLSECGTPVFLHMGYYRYLQHIGITDDFSEGNVSTFEKRNYRSLELHKKYLKKHPLEVAVSEMVAAGWEKSDVEKSIDRIADITLKAYSKALGDQFSSYGEAEGKVYFD